MSNQTDLTQVQTIAAALIANLPDEIAKSNGSLFPNGVNYLFLKVQFGNTQIEFEVSSTNATHAQTLTAAAIPDKTVRPGHP